MTQYTDANANTLHIAPVRTHCVCVCVYIAPKGVKSLMDIFI